MPNIQAHFDVFLSRLEPNATFQNAISTHHNAVRSIVENNLPSHVRTQLIGSLQRKTRIQPRSNETFDIDILLVLGRFTGWESGGTTTHQAHGTGQAALAGTRYHKMDPVIDEPAISFEYADNVKVEIVPAFEDHIGYGPNGENMSPLGRGYWVARENGLWVHADYDHDAGQITELNAVTDGKFVPAIKLLKALKRRHFPSMSSFHLELLAATWIPAIVQYLKNNQMIIDYPIILHWFFGCTKDTLTEPVSLNASNTPALSLDPLSCIRLRTTFTELHSTIGRLNSSSFETTKIEGWRRLFQDPFPSRV